MGALFGRPKTPSNLNSRNVGEKRKAPEITEKDRAILDLKVARDKLKKYKKKLEIDSEKFQQQARQLISKNQRNRAILVLKLRKHRETELNKVDAQLYTVHEMINTVEWASQNLEILKALKAGTSALNKIHEEMSVEDVANLLEETNEAAEVESQISQMFAGGSGVIDDEELEKELAELMGFADEVESKVVSSDKSSSAVSYPEVPSDIILPKVPNNKITKNLENQNHLAVPS